MSHTPLVKSDYLGDVFKNKKKVASFLTQATKLVKQYNFEAFAFRGMSGALIAPLLAYKANKTMIMVRKPKPYNDQCYDHSRQRVEGDSAAKRYIIIDDIRCTGRTIQDIIERVSEFAPRARCLGMIMYMGVISYGDSLVIERVPHSQTWEKFVIADPESCRIKNSLK